ncbi:MAG TPA: glycosyltransferase [Candidatus Limnocylindrales bacterium]|nr:glycosyltransferase [Candidatus Limnocylindrales bacterium]
MISAVIPARNEEESVARAVESVAAQPGVGEVIVVDDQSSDGTHEVLAGLERRIAKLRVLETGELPADWVGKNYAAWLGAGAATGDWLLFTDADTQHLPGSAARALADAAKHEAAIVSYSPEQELGSVWERVLIPVVYWRLSKRFSFDEVSDPNSSQAAANGQYLLIQRSAYAAIGGHAAVAGEILEDVAVARRAKQAGYKIYFASGAGIVRTRMYRSFGAMWEGWTKNLHSLMGWPGVALGNLLVWCGIVAALILIGRRYFGESAWMVLFAPVGFVILWAVQYSLFLRRNRYPLSYIRYFVPGVCLYAAARAASWWKTTRGMVEWKGRAYRAEAP